MGEHKTSGDAALGWPGMPDFRRLPSRCRPWGPASLNTTAPRPPQDSNASQAKSGVRRGHKAGWPMTVTACMNWCNGDSVQPGAGCYSWSHFDESCYLFTNSTMSTGPDYLYSSTCQTVPSPPPPPPPPRYMCLHGKCVLGKGVSKDVCEKICIG